MADVLQFDPATEYVVIETIEDFEEEVQRPEELRFFTLDEQLTDYFQKMLPARKATRFELKQLEKERDRIRLAYEKTISISDTEYVIDTQRKKVRVSWVTPIYGDFQYKPYAWETEWRPIVEDRKTPNYYPRLISALPRPFNVSGQEGVPLNQSTVMVDGEGNNPIHALSMFETTRTIMREDGSTDIISERIRNTQDELLRIGYYLDRRPLDLPNPLMDHPFLKSVQPGKVMTNLDLNDAFPSIQAIMEHAVPTTQDPYREGSQYLKLYDVRFAQIPYFLWKVKFPPADMISTTPQPTPISFPAPEDIVPSKILTSAYALEWLPGYNQRLWTSLQVDGGLFVSTLFVANANQVGLLAISPPVPAPAPTYPPGDTNVCESLSTDFDTFLNAGLFRFGKKDKDGLPVDIGVCVPVGMIQKEQSDLITAGRLPWTESLETDLRAQHEALLKQFQVPIVQFEGATYAKAEVREDSERRLNVVSILEDSERTPDDKADAIEILTRELEVTNRVYLDTQGRFVVCSHTLSLLRGDLEDDRLAFYAEWTRIDEGKRVCQYCSEEINNDVIVATEEYDEDGHLVMTYERIEQNLHLGHDPVQNTLLGMKKLFDLDNQGELLLYTYISLLQVVPEEGQLVSVLQMIRKISTALKSVAATRKLSKSDQERAEGLIGLAGTIILFQTHTPFLIPKRSFGGKMLKMSGFPRDTQDPDDSAILSGLIQIIKHIVEKYPGAFKGAVFKAIASGKIRVEATRYIATMAKQFATILEEAKQRFAAEPEILEHMNDIQTPVIAIADPFFAPDEVMGKEEQSSSCGARNPGLAWTTRHPPNLVQVQPPLFARIYPSPGAIDVPQIIEQVALEVPSDKEIRDKVKMGVPAGFPAFAEFARQSHDGTMYITITSRILDILAQTDMKQDDIMGLRDALVRLNTHGESSLVRDMAKGVFFQTLHTIKDQRNSAGIVRTLNEEAKHDLPLRMMMISKEKAEKEDEKLIATERLTFKQKYREMSDAQREVTKMLVDIGISDYLITNEDRERFAREYRMMIDTDETPEEVPEEGERAERDYIDEDVPLAADGVHELQVDYGDYGDRQVMDYNDYSELRNMDMNEGDRF